MNALPNANTRRSEEKSPNIGFTAHVPPGREKRPNGVSVEYVQDPAKKWFVLRASYGRTKKACEILQKDSEEYYLPLHYVIKRINNKKKRVLQPLLPNFVFVYAKEEYIKSLVGDAHRNSYLSYYYNHFEVSEFGKNPPLTIDFDSMMNFIKATSIDDEHVRIVEPQACHYKSGSKVRIIEGKFKGVEGKVARVAGQQRVVVELHGLCLIATAYIPTAFITAIDEK